MRTQLKTLAGAVTALAILLCVPAPAQERGAGPTPRQVFVVNTQDASVSLVDIATMKEVRRIPVGPRPYGVVVSRDGRRLAVGVEDEEKVKFFDTTDFKLLGEARIGKMFNDHIVLTPDGRHILVANFYSDVVAIDAETMKEPFASRVRVRHTSSSTGRCENMLT